MTELQLAISSMVAGVFVAAVWDLHSKVAKNKEMLWEIKTSLYVDHRRDELARIREKVGEHPLYKYLRLNDKQIPEIMGDSDLLGGDFKRFVDEGRTMTDAQAKAFQAEMGKHFRERYFELGFEKLIYYISRRDADELRKILFEWSGE